MPRNTDGTWIYPTQFKSWREWKVAFTEMVAPNNMKYAACLAETCERTRENPGTYCRRWAYWHGKFEGGKLIPPNWPDDMTAGDWKSLAMFAEHEAANVGA